MMIPMANTNRKHNSSSFKKISHPQSAKNNSTNKRLNAEPKKNAASNNLSKKKRKKTPTLLRMKPVKRYTRSK